MTAYNTFAQLLATAEELQTKFTDLLNAAQSVTVPTGEYTITGAELLALHESRVSVASFAAGIAELLLGKDADLEEQRSEYFDLWDAFITSGGEVPLSEQASD